MALSDFDPSWFAELINSHAFNKLMPDYQNAMLGRYNYDGTETGLTWSDVGKRLGVDAGKARRMVITAAGSLRRARNDAPDLIRYGHPWTAGAELSTMELRLARARQELIDCKAMGPRWIARHEEQIIMLEHYVEEAKVRANTPPPKRCSHCGQVLRVKK